MEYLIGLLSKRNRGVFFRFRKDVDQIEFWNRKKTPTSFSAARKNSYPVSRASTAVLGPAVRGTRRLVSKARRSMEDGMPTVAAKALNNDFPGEEVKSMPDGLEERDNALASTSPIDYFRDGRKHLRSLSAFAGKGRL